MTVFKAKKLIISDDHPLFREALQQAIVNTLGDLEITTCGSFSSLQREITTESGYDLILLDLHMPGAVGFSALHYLGLCCPEIPVAIVSANEDPEIIFRALNLGASGFIPKSSSIEEIVEAVKRILNGEVWAPDKLDALSTRPEHDDSEFNGKLDALTPKQFRVLMMLVEGRTNSDIADETCVTVATIKAHLGEIFKKLGVTNRTQAAMVAATHLELEDPNQKSFD